MRLPFGRHANVQLCDLPDGYVAWMLQEKGLLHKYADVEAGVLQAIRQGTAGRSGPRVPFGKYKGALVCDVPSDYVAWLLREGLGSFRGITEHLVAGCQAALAQARGGAPAVASPAREHPGPGGPTRHKYAAGGGASSPYGRPVPGCRRCGRGGHLAAQCVAMTHVDGGRLGTHAAGLFLRF